MVVPSADCTFFIESPFVDSSSESRTMENGHDQATLIVHPRDAKKLLLSCSLEKQEPHADISENRARNGSLGCQSLFLAMIRSPGVTSSRGASAMLASQSCC